MKKIFFLLAVAYSYMLAAQTSLPTWWDFKTPAITSPPSGWTLMNTLPASTGGQTYAFGAGDNISCRFDAQGEYLIINFADRPGQLSYWVSPQNAGNPWSGLFEVQESDSGSVWTNIRSFTSATTTPTNFTNGRTVDNNLKATSRYVRFIFTTKSVGNFALDSVMLQAAPPPPNATINIKQAANTLINGSTFVIGKTDTTTFTVENKGMVNTLNITSANITGVNASDYSLLGMPTSVVAQSSATFKVVFKPTGTGSKFAAFNISSNDSTKSPYVVNMYGIAGSFATEPAASATQPTITNLKAYGFTVSFNNASPKPERYIVLRKNGFLGPLTEAPTDGQTYTRGDYIGAAQVAYVGTDTTFKPAYILSTNDYAFKVFSYNGPAGFENYLTSSSLATVVAVPATSMGTYYNGVNPTASNFIQQLSNKINPHDTVFYSQYISRMIDPFVTRDTSGGKKVVTCVYTNAQYSYNDPFTWWNGQSGNPGTLTREHTFAQSWMPSNQGGTWPNGANGREVPEYNDLHHLFPADQINGNGKRSNFPFGEVVGTPTFVSPTGMGKLGLDSKGATVWEPRNEHKGDVARALFYMCVAYNGINGKSWVLPAQQDQAVLKKWHLQDPPDNWEMTRNEYIASLQNNRNPFIDSPSWAARIDFSTLTLVGSITPTIAVSSPTLAEKVLAGTVKNITWLSAGMDSIKIEYTTNGSTYTPVANSVAAASGTYAWMVPATASTNVRVKLTDKASTATATSPVFIIAVPSVALTSPVGGEVWKSKDTNTIAWTSSDIDTVKIQLWLSDTLHSTIIAKTPASAGSYKWNANPILSSVQAKVKISDIKSSASSTSTNYFTLQSNVGLNETTANMDDVIRVFPNPSKGQVSVIAPANARINIYTIEGKKLNAATKQEHDAFVYPKLDAGIYLLEIDIADKKVYRKVVVE